MTACNLPAVNRDGSLLAKLFFSFMHLSDEVYEPLAGLGNALLWPIGELKLANCPRLAIAGIGHLKLGKIVVIDFHRGWRLERRNKSQTPDLRTASL